MKSANGRGLSALIVLTLAAMVLSLYLALLWAPTEQVMGLIQRIFYFHVPVAISAFVAFFVVFVASIAFLISRRRVWDLLAYSAAEVGVLFCTLTLITGSLWARPVWGAWWTWEPRLTTALVLWIMYVTYLLLRPLTEGSERGARFAAVFGLVAFLDVPIVFMSIRWWQSGVHPLLLRGVHNIGLDPRMAFTLLVGLVTMLLLCAALIAFRFRLARFEDALNARLERVQ